MSADKPIPVLSSDRLLLRAWRHSDLEPFAAMNADDRVTRFLPSKLTRRESDSFFERIQADFARHGFGLWAVERIDVPERPFIGYVGLSIPTFEGSREPRAKVSELENRRRSSAL